MILRRLLVATLAVAVLSCGRKAPRSASADAALPGAPGDGGDGSRGGSPLDSSLAGAIATAEDRRRATAVPALSQLGQDVALRRLAARALARIGDPGSEPGLLQLLSDEDLQTVGWAAYGLGWSCKGHEEAHVRAISARAASLGDEDPASDAGDVPRNAIDARTSIARAVGRCGGELAERVLAGWVKAQGGWAERAALALGDIAGRRGRLGEDTQAVLLDAPAHAAMLYPFARVEHVEPATAARVLSAVRSALGRPGAERAFAIRALSRCGAEAAPDLARVVGSKDFTASERAEAARGLKLLGDQGKGSLAEALGQLTPDKDPFAIAALGGDTFDVLLTLVQAVGDDAPKAAEPALRALATLRAPGEAPPALARRLEQLRCASAGALARGAYDADLITRCADDAASEAQQRARLAAIGRRPIDGARRTAWRALAKSANLRVAEAAIELESDHPELGETGRAALADALGSAKGGLVATAAEAVHTHPDRVLVLAEREKRAALDPNAPLTVNPARELDPSIAKALEAALGHAWAEDLVETRTALVDAAAAVHLAGAREAAAKACHDPNITVREHATKALRELGEAAPSCGAPEGDGSSPARPDPTLVHPTRVTLATDAGSLSITFEPELAPMAAARFVALARAGFYDGVVAHRVVPGFVVQLGDPGGDGYGGSGALLRCETSPVPFGRLDVGVALAGRDTGSSQIFVTLARVPHLDGEYARVGTAEGDWDAVAQGDVISHVKVEE
jgi:cyclophilin family peptidyl-prolyl cis-trans isomerase